MSGRKLWLVCLAVFLLLWGLLAITNVRFSLQNELMGILAIATAALICFDK